MEETETSGEEQEKFYKKINAEIEEEEEELGREREIVGEVNEKFPRSVGFIIGNEFCER